MTNLLLKTPTKRNDTINSFIFIHHFYKLHRILLYSRIRRVLFTLSPRRIIQALYLRTAVRLRGGTAI